jgi:ABC-type transport system involved in multi-copper enzyme maturation permease subunit
MFWQVLSIEGTKINRRGMFWVLFVLIAILVLIIQVVLISTYEKGLSGVAIPEDERLSIKEAITWPGGLVHVLTYIGGSAFGGLFFVILVGAVTAQEYTWRTMHLWLSRGVSRSLLMVAKFTALLLPAMLLVLAAFLIGGSITALTSIRVDDALHLYQVNFMQLALSILRTAYTLLPYGALTFFLAVVSRSTVVAISSGVSYVLLLESLLLQLFRLIGGSMEKVVPYLPNRLAEGLMSANQLTVNTRSILSTGSVSPWTAVIGIASWTLLFLGLSMWVFQRQDLSQ